MANQRSLQDIVAWTQEEAPLRLIRTCEAALPGGLSMAMAPLIVDWDGSKLEGDDGYYLIRNVNIGGNPVAGTTMLATIRVPIRSVCNAEYVVVPVKMVGQDTMGAHGQLRLIFEKGRGGTLLDRSGKPLANNAEIRDLVFSWEAWRPPGTGFDALKGLDNKNYMLTTRCFHGAQRFLEDGLQNRPWLCYPLQFPRVEGAWDELLFVCLQLGDSLGRHSMTWLMKNEAVAAGHEGTATGYAEAWKALKESLHDDSMPEDPFETVLDGTFDYSLLERSCITMALTAIDFALSKIHEKRGLTGYAPLRTVPEDIPDWVRSLAKGSTHDVFTRVPNLFWWLMKNREVVPTNSVHILRDGGLVKKLQDGGIIHTRYDFASGETPYGSLKDGLIA